MTQKLSDSIEFLRSREGLFLVLVAALLVQAPHSAEVFHRISTSAWPTVASWAHAAVFAIVLELAVLLFVVRGRKELSWGFASISVLMNVFYYYADTWWAWASIPLVIECIVTSISLPLAIAFYSHEVAGDNVHSPESVQPAPAPMHKPVAQAEAPAQTEDAQPPVTEKATRAKQLKSEGLTNVQIAAELGVHRNSVPKLLNGHKEPA